MDRTEAPTNGESRLHLPTEISSLARSLDALFLDERKFSRIPFPVCPDPP